MDYSDYLKTFLDNLGTKLKVKDSKLELWGKCTEFLRYSSLVAHSRAYSGLGSGGPIK